MGNGRGYFVVRVYNKQSDKRLSSQLQAGVQEVRKQRNFDAKKYIAQKAELLNSYMKKCKLSACVIGVSGGVDSAIVLGLVNHASKQKGSPIKKVVPLLMPILKSSGTTNQGRATSRGVELCEKLGLEPIILDLSKENFEIKEAVEHGLNLKGNDWALGQLVSYSRTPVLYYTTSVLTQEGFSAITCGTTNRDEGAYLGFIGKASDAMVDIQLISDIHKSEVYKVAQELGVPDVIISALPSGDMYDSRTDETVFGASYDFVEFYLNYLNWEDSKKQSFYDNLNEESKQQFDLYSSNLENLHRYNAHKYLAKSPAVHLDLMDASVRGGWDNYYEVIKKFMSK